MAERWAVKDGNWSDPATWNGGTLPGASDDVYANGYTVTIDQDVTCVALHTNAGATAAAGGGFVMSASRIIAADIVAGASPCLTGTGGSLSLTGDVTGGSSSNSYGIDWQSTGSLTIVGDVTGGTNNWTYPYALRIAANCSVSIVGLVLGGVSSSDRAIFFESGLTASLSVVGDVTGSGYNAAGIYVSSSSDVDITVTGTVRGAPTNRGRGIEDYGTGDLIVVGDVYGSTYASGQDGQGIAKYNGGSIDITGDCYAGYGGGTRYYAVAVYSSWVPTTIEGSLKANLDPNGYGLPPVLCYALSRRNIENAVDTYCEGTSPGSYTGNAAYLYGANQGGFGHPAESDVRDGTVYGPSSELTGTCKVPAPQSVLYGVPVDDTVGQFAVLGSTGARTVTTTVNDGANPIEGAKVRYTLGTENYVQQTDANGQCTHNLDDGTWTVAISKPGYSFAGDTLVVDGDKTPTYSMTAINITQPSDPSESTGYLVCYDEQGSTEQSVTVTVQLVSGPGDAGYAYDTKLWSEQSDSSGLVEFVGLIRGAKYKIRRGDGQWTQFTVPDAQSFAINEIVGID